MRGEPDQIKTLLAAHATHSAASDEWTLFQLAALLRVQLLSWCMDSETIEHAKAILPKAGIWTGELELLIATAYSVGEDHVQAQVWFKKAMIHLEELGAKKKAIKARLNIVVADTFIFPQKNQISEFYHVFRQATKTESHEHMVASTALLNLSRQYQKAGCLLASLKYANMGMRQVENAYHGSVIHHLMTAQRCQIYYQIGRVSAAEQDFEIVRSSEFLEVKSAVTLIEMAYRSQIVEIPGNQGPLGSWQDRWEQFKSCGTLPNKWLSNYEEKLVLYISRGPKNRYDILNHLYGEKIPIEAKINRFKNLIANLRKKIPNQITCEDGYYSLADFLDAYEKKNA